MGRGDKDFWRRRFLGTETPQPTRDGPRVWFHAASVGEVTGALGVIRRLGALEARTQVFLSVGTPQGYLFARSHLPENVRVFAAPLDVPWAVQRTVMNLHPHLFVALESEFWPVLHGFLRKYGIPVVLLNGRMSERSWRRYQRFFPVFRSVFGALQWASVKTAEDKRRLISLGVSPDRIAVMGSAKYDTLQDRADSSLITSWRRRLDLDQDIPVMVCGSLRGEECRTLLNIFVKLKRECGSLVGIFAPRHLDRVSFMTDWLQRHGVAYELLSSFLSETESRRRCDCLVVDGIGHLFDLYGLGNLVFCGGTLVPVGGHNIVEPVAWQKTVHYGPHVEKVMEEHRVLQEHGVGIMVHSAEELYERWRKALLAGTLPEFHKSAARKALQELGGVADRQVKALQGFLNP